MIHHQRRDEQGFSYTQLIFALLIILILNVAMLPSYRESILKTRRAEARSALHTVMLQQERFYTQHNTYQAFSSATEDTSFKWWSGHSPMSSYYEISASTCPDKLLTHCVLLTAKPVKTKIMHVDDPVCGDLMLDSVNTKTYSHDTAPNPLCW